MYMSNIETAILKAEQRCRDHGSRLTPRRRQVLRALIEAGEPISAYGLLEVCNTQGLDAMPAMSMYRILDYLVEQQLAHRLESSKKYVACSHINCCTEHFQRTQFPSPFGSIRGDRTQVPTSSLSAASSSLQACFR